MVLLDVYLTLSIVLLILNWFVKFDCLIIEGGGFKTAFTSGVLDAFISINYFPFKTLIGISGGAVAMSYFASNQYRYCIKSLRLLSKDDQFSNYKRTFGEKGYLDIDYLATVASQKVPFDMDLALERTKNKEVVIVATDRKKGLPVYFNPTKKDWVQKVIASSTLPFATKGVHKLNGRSYFDGGWSDPLPVKWAYANGAKKILVIRTKPRGIREKQSWSDYFGSKYYRTESALSKVFESNFNTYNDAADFLENPPKDLVVEQIDPKFLLKSGVYSYSKKTLMLDYRYGVDKGLFFLNKTLNKS